jgi:hypothetical protein
MISEERDKIQKAAKEANIEIILGKDWVILL